MERIFPSRQVGNSVFIGSRQRRKPRIEPWWGQCHMVNRYGVGAQCPLQTPRKCSQRGIAEVKIFRQINMKDLSESMNTRIRPARNNCLEGFFIKAQDNPQRYF